MDSRQRPGTLSPDPWHFAPSASSMVAARRRQGTAAALGVFAGIAHLRGPFAARDKTGIFSCHWSKAANAGGLGAEPPRDREAGKNRSNLITPVEEKCP